MITTYCGDCLEVMRQLPDESVDVVIMDPPYFRIMIEDYTHQTRYDWDDQWKDIKEYDAWMESIFAEVRRLCRKTASIFVFCDDLVGAHVQIQFEKHFNILNNIVWQKPDCHTMKGWTGYRKFVPVTERILFGEMAKAPGMPMTGLEQIHCDPECFKEVRDYLVSE